MHSSRGVVFLFFGLASDIDDGIDFAVVIDVEYKRFSGPGADFVVCRTTVAGSKPETRHGVRSAALIPSRRGRGVNEQRCN